MRRLAATLRCDLRLQLRNGFYYATALVVVASVILLRCLPEEDGTLWAETDVPATRGAARTICCSTLKAMS